MAGFIEAGLKKYRSDEKGMTLIEILVAISILSLALLGMLASVSTGLVQLNEQRIKRTAAECARVLSEYIGTIPPDMIFAGDGDTLYGTFATDVDFSIAQFVNSSNSACRELSDASSTKGAKVQLRYSICPGCVTYTDVDPDTLVSWTTCYYTMETKVSWNGLMYGGVRTITYNRKFYSGVTGPCDQAKNPDGCGLGSIPATVVNCKP